MSLSVSWRRHIETSAKFPRRSMGKRGEFPASHCAWSTVLWRRWRMAFHSNTLLQLSRQSIDSRSPASKGGAAPLRPAPAFFLTHPTRSPLLRAWDTAPGPRLSVPLSAVRSVGGIAGARRALLDERSRQSIDSRLPASATITGCCKDIFDATLCDPTGAKTR